MKRKEKEYSDVHFGTAGLMVAGLLTEMVYAIIVRLL